MTEQTIKHPIYLHALDIMEAEGIDYGAAWSVLQLSTMLRCNPETWEFRSSMINIRARLRERGYNFTARGTSGQVWQIAPPETNADEMQRLQKTAIRAVVNAVVLGTATDTSRLTTDQKARHDATLERAGTRAALLNRTTKQIAAEAK